MAKNAKRLPINHDKPITAFFTRASKAPSSQDAHPSAAKKASSANLEVNGSQNSSTVVSSSLENASKPATRPSNVATRTQSTRARSAEAQAALMSPLSASSLKRSRSPDIQPSKLSTPKAVQNVKSRQRSKFDSDSESESNGVVVYVKATPNTQRRKKARLSSPEGPSRSETGNLVPSSQSDEDELFRSGTEPIPPKNGSHYPQTTSLPLTPSAGNDGMNVDEDLFSDRQLPLGSASSTSKSFTHKSSSPFDQILTPPVSDPLPLPPTPVALDAASKSAKIIAEIKARAYANSMSSPETVPFEFNDELESSSDEDDLLTMSNIVPKSTSKSQTTNHQDTSAIAARRSTRYTFRTRPPSPLADGAGAIASTSRPPTQKATLQSSRKQGKKITIADPFAALLKEKKLSEKRGNHEDAFRRAEITVRKFSRDARESEIEDFEDDTPELTEDDAIRLATENPLWLTSKLMTPDSIQDRKETSSVRQDDRRRLFAEGGGGTILDILEHDKAVKRQDELSERVGGIHLWCASDREMVINQRSTSYPFPGKTPILNLLNASLKSGDFYRAKTLLGMDFMTIVNVSERMMTAAALYDLAFSDRFPVLHDAAVLALNSFWGAANQSTINTVSFSQTLEIVQSLGADRSILSALNWRLDESISPRNVDTANRERFIQRLVMLVSTCARSRIIALKDANDFVLLLLLVGMDMTASPILMREVAEAIDLVCHGISPHDSISIDAELNLCSRIAACASRYEPVNKALLVSLLASGSGSTRRIANFVAYCILTDQENPNLLQKIYSDAPPLHGILAHLIPNSKATPGKFAIHEGTDYVDLGFYITILGVAVSNIRTYVSREREIRQVNVSESLSKGGERSKSLLQLLHGALETLHSNIADTRATHLERSRAKAGIKGLAMNIHYQREIWLRNDAPVKAKTLAQYFKKTAKT